MTSEREEPKRTGTGPLAGWGTYYQQRYSLEHILSPQKVAVIGASEEPGSVGRTLVENLVARTFSGEIFPVNPNHETILGLKTYSEIGAVPGPVDLAVITTPARTVPAIIGQCIAAEVRGVIVISAGFKEAGPQGVERERQILEQIRQSRTRLIGPNCLGVMNPLTGFNATFAGRMVKPGNVAFISQSGALCTAVIDWSLKENVGFSAFISVGSMLDVGWGDLIDYLGDDMNTKSIVIYMESIGDARAFLSAAREVALTKPIIVIKAGRTQAAAQAAASHTGSLTGSDEVLDAAFRRSGVLRVNTIAEMFYMAEVLSKQPRPLGPRLTILTNAGGPGVLATDALIADGGELTTLSDEVVNALNEVLPRHWSHSNPIDIIGDAGPERYAKATEIAVKDPNSNGLLVIVTPQAMTNPTRTAEELRRFAKANKPVIVSAMGGAEIAAAEQILNQANIPTFPYPDTAARLFNYMWRYTTNLNGLYETPMLPSGVYEDAAGRAQAKAIINAARQSGRTLLTEPESKQVLAAYGIATVPTRSAESEEEAAAIASELGYPVVLKILSQTITHKTDVGGVKLNLADETEVREAYRAIQKAVSKKVGPEHFQGVTVQPMIEEKGYELILGSSVDPQFGPVLLFGSGGELVEVYRDRALALPPLNTTLARRLMERTRIFTALKGVRGHKPVDLAGLEQLLVRFSQLIAEQRWIKELDINPLLATPDRLLALDARIVVYGPEVSEAELPKLAIRPYPRQYIKEWKMKDGTPVTIRPIRPEDEPLMAKFHETLSERSIYFRYFHMIGLNQRIAHERLSRICFVDYTRTMVLVAECQNPQSGEKAILGVGRLSKLHNSNDADFALLISDKAQGKGLGSELLRQLIAVGKAEKLDRILGDILLENQDMQRVAKKVGFHLRYSPEEGDMKAEYNLKETPEGA